MKIKLNVWGEFLLFVAQHLFVLTFLSPLHSLAVNVSVRLFFFFKLELGKWVSL